MKYLTLILTLFVMGCSSPTATEEEIDGNHFKIGEIRYNINQAEKIGGKWLIVSTGTLHAFINDEGYLDITGSGKMFATDMPNGTHEIPSKYYCNITNAKNGEYTSVESIESGTVDITQNSISLTGTLKDGRDVQIKYNN